MRPPAFWTDDGALARALTPLGHLYALGDRWRRRAATPWRAPVPVVCIGNLTVGGAGKTPTSIAIAQRLAASGRKPVLVSRGYRGRLAGPVRVDPLRHSAADVGDEPLLLAETAPTVVAKDRLAGVRAALDLGAEVVVLDDGFQDPRLSHDLALVVVDGGTGFGNGRVLPAGPLRELVADGLARADAVVVIGHGQIRTDRPVLRARLVPDEASLRFRGRKVLAFAGIGRPEKAFATLAEIGADVVRTRSFADHYAYDEDDAAILIEEAAGLGAEPVTTRKDWVRLPAAAKPLIAVVDVDLVFADEDEVARRLAELRRG
ncbi:MAG: tetraacyldisaccharide 4'-kinase [Alphaproteobacteria bacterium]|nr:tetraacyldisaccharide 4'-kinase [Alphaproteobacteria bacterium]